MSSQPKAFEWFRKAKEEKFALGAFNAGNIETLKAIVGAAKKLSSPVIIEASPGEIEYFGMREMAWTVRALEVDYKIPIILNLDHAVTYESCYQALELGFDSIHFDGGKMEYSENVRIAKMLVIEAHKRSILVEGEIDHIGGSSADHREVLATDFQSTTPYSDPEKAKKFMEETGVDTFAAFAGNVHGLYQGEKHIDLDLLKKIGGALPGKFLSLHGGSGISGEQIHQAIELGVVKINVNSELRVAFYDTVKKTLNDPSFHETAIYEMMPSAIEAVEEVVCEKILLFGSAGKI